MTGILGPNGQPISSSAFQAKKKPAPSFGDKFGVWGGESSSFGMMPGANAITFDTSRLMLSDFRQMRGHYQINSSLSVLTFMMHQMDWHIESPNKRVSELVERQLRNVWSRLVRAHSQALWAGFAPNALEWENDFTGREVVLTKIKDLVPEDCRVNWKKTTYTYPGGGKFTQSHYDGIRQFGAPGPIPVENSYWYPLLMENGNYYGRRILESAFQPWFFSTLMHLFANRYYERFGEPTPVGRAPYDDEITVNGKTMQGNQLMASIVQQIRNRSVVVLPNDRTQLGDEPNVPFDYQLEYLESQMRGADFERYMTRLDEEMSLAMFTPILMMRTADVGSYNLGTQHTQVYQWMLNAISGDWADYINKYIIRPIVGYNFNGNPIPARIVFTKMGKTSAQLLQSIITALLGGDKIKLDVREIGEMAGLTIEEIEDVADEAPAPPAEEEPSKGSDGKEQVEKVKQLITKRVGAQLDKAFMKNTFGTNDFSLQVGYKRQLAEALQQCGISGAAGRVDDAYVELDKWVGLTSALGADEYERPEVYLNILERKLGDLVEIHTR